MASEWREGFSAVLNLSEATRRVQLHDLESKHFQGVEAAATAATVTATTRRRDIHSRWIDRRSAKRRQVEAAPTNAAQSAGDDTGVKRLLTFLRVLEICSNAPWSAVKFPENEKMLKRLTAAHMQLIVGREEWERDKNLLFSLLDSSENLSNTVNVCWVTNRQQVLIPPSPPRLPQCFAWVSLLCVCVPQGKTTTLSRFLAALALCSVKGGVLATVYSTSLDRSCELVKASKKYIYYLQHDEGAIKQLEVMGLSKPRMSTDNERQFSVQSIAGPGIVNTCIGRPKNADSCRGDAPAAAFFDEIGFISPQFWWSFAFPLLQVGGRVFTMATTPAPLDSFFDNFCKKIQAENQENKFFFHLINHSLVCEKCLETNPQQCSHKLFLIPPWKSIQRFESLRRMVPGKQKEEFQAEVFGVLKRSTTTFFPKKIVAASLKWSSARDLRDVEFVGLSSAETDQFVIYCAIDPASHQKSSMGLCALAYTSTGRIVLLAASEVPMKSSDLIQCQMICERFIFRLFSNLSSAMHVNLATTVIVPVVECNNNDILALSLVRAINSAAGQIGARSGNPFKRAFFQTGISDCIGVLTTEATKYAMIQATYSALLDNRMIVAKQLTTMGPIHLRQHTHPSKSEALDLLHAELGAFQETKNGPSGKGADRCDDLAMAFMMGVYWSHCVRATANVHGGRVLD